jgi:hypothetical protein
MTIEIRFSGQLDEKEAFNRITEIKASLRNETIVINLSGIDSARPLGTVIFANQLRLIVKENPQTKFEFQGYETNRFGLDYLAQANFFRYLDIPRDNKKYHNTNFDIPIPLHDIKRSEINQRVRDSKSGNFKTPEIATNRPRRL